MRFIDGAAAGVGTFVSLFTEVERPQQTREKDLPSLTRHLPREEPTARGGQFPV